MKPKSNWTPARRARYRRMMMRRQPWLVSTGPRTAQGKRRSRLNARRHGLRSRVLLGLISYVRTAVMLVTQAEAKAALRT
jgi:hypothetical protein